VCLLRVINRFLVYLEVREARKCSTAQGPHSEVVPRAFWRIVSKSCDECKGSFARGCEAKRWSHWTCSSLGTIFQPMRINSVPGVKCFCNNKNVLRAQSMVWHFVRHSVYYQTPYKPIQQCLYEEVHCHLNALGTLKFTTFIETSRHLVLTWTSLSQCVCSLYHSRPV